MCGVVSGIEDAAWLHLGEDEDILWNGRPSKYTIAFQCIAGLVVGAIGIWGWYLMRGSLTPDSRLWMLQIVPVIVAAAGVLFTLYVFLDWLRILYVITTQEIYVKRGLISRDVTQVRLSRIQNTTFEQSMVQRALSFGDVHLYTAGSGTEDVTFHDVPRPEAVTELLTDSLRIDES